MTINPPKPLHFLIFSLCVLVFYLYTAFYGEKYFGYEGCPVGDYAIKSKVQYVYDGDTITINPLSSMRYGDYHKVRLLDIQAPELKTKSGNYIAKGVRSRDYLRELLKGKDVIIKTDRNRRGYYGRLLATVYTVNHELKTCTNVNQIMLSSGYAVPYAKGK